jgi:ribosomal protein L37AE/L43A
MKHERHAECPRCETTLTHTGGFWKCMDCGFAVTDQALKANLMQRTERASDCFRIAG